jgi:alkylation response protein AidB-like acyl-CoA dehydrogenase
MAANLHDLPSAPVVPDGGSFLLRPVGDARLHAAEAFTDEQRQYYQTCRQFVLREVVPNAARIESKDLPFLKELLRKAGELGLLMIEIPEEYGGLNLDVTTAMLVSEAATLLGSWSVTMGAHTGIGTLPIVYFGTDAQKRKYLPKLATAEWVAAYALTESGSGSDALGAKTRADLSKDGKSYVLNGSKQFITNAGMADVFIVFAKVNGDKFTAFIVERGTPGFTIGPEEHKMGIRGSSTCPLTFEECAVPVENVLGDIGKGHKIAFNILNLGRLKLGVGSVGGSRGAIGVSARYAKERRQFGKPIDEFGLIRDKLANMAAATYALESMAYRTTGLIDARLQQLSEAARRDRDKVILAVEEYSIESSILKVMGSETLAMCIDEAVQIHGGYGFIQGYDVERSYRDQRINRIYEGTNEINRMLVTGMLLKRAAKGQLPLLEAVAAIDEAPPASPPGSNGPLDAERGAAEGLKRMALLALKVAVEKFGVAIEDQQTVLAAIADVVGEAYALDSAVARTLQFDPNSRLRLALCRLLAFGAVPRAQARARFALCASADGAELQKELEHLDNFNVYPPINPAAEGEIVAKAVLDAGDYPLSSEG